MQPSPHPVSIHGPAISWLLRIGTTSDWSLSVTMISFYSSLASFSLLFLFTLFPFSPWIFAVVMVSYLFLSLSHSFLVSQFVLCFAGWLIAIK